jgi:hypothetical protein
MDTPKDISRASPVSAPKDTSPMDTPKDSD